MGADRLKMDFTRPLEFARTAQRNLFWFCVLVSGFLLSSAPGDFRKMSRESVDFDSFLEEFCGHSNYTESSTMSKAIISETYEGQLFLFADHLRPTQIRAQSQIMKEDYLNPENLQRLDKLRQFFCEQSRPKESFTVADAVDALRELSAVYRFFRVELSEKTTPRAVAPEHCPVDELLLETQVFNLGFTHRLLVNCDGELILPPVGITGNTRDSDINRRKDPIGRILYERKLATGRDREKLTFLPNLSKFGDEYGERKYGDIKAVIERKAYDQKEQVLLFAGISISRGIVRLIVPIIMLGLQIFAFMHFSNLRRALEYSRGSPVSAEVKFFPWMGLYESRLARLSTFTSIRIFPIALLAFVSWPQRPEDIGDGLVAVLFSPFVVGFGLISLREVLKIRGMISAALVK
ncbi:MAG: hypothetical protein NXI24_24540 [bacterium]|nr:hypothetical protein [bacterium]